MTDKNPDGVRVTDVDMPFSSMVKFMVKWAIASIPTWNWSSDWVPRPTRCA